LVVASKPATTNSEIINSTTDPAAQAVLNSEDNAGGYLDSAASELNERVEPIEAPKQAKITEPVEQLSPGDEIQYDADPDFDISDNAEPEETAMPMFYTTEVGPEVRRLPDDLLSIKVTPLLWLV